MQEIFSRTQMLLGENAMEKLKKARTAVFGIGGVGGYAAEALVRCGVGSIDLIDNDRVAPSNINRQIYALQSNIGQMKTEAAAQRIHLINPDVNVTVHNMFFMPENSSELDFSQFDYVVDAIDTVTGKIEIIMCADRAKVPVISSMGTGNKLDPTAFEIADIYKTSVCPLARVMRRELKARGVKHLKVLYSKEEPIKPKNGGEQSGSEGRRSVPGSVSFVPSVAGLIIAGEVIKDLIGEV